MGGKDPKYSPLGEPRIKRPNRLKAIRERHKNVPGGFWISQLEASRILGVSHATVSLHESGKRGMTDKEIQGYARLYKVAPWEIFHDPAERKVAHVPANSPIQKSKEFVMQVADEAAQLPDEGSDELTTLFKKLQ